jgi:hypothetical protein
MASPAIGTAISPAAPINSLALTSLKARDSASLIAMNFESISESRSKTRVYRSRAYRAGF